MIAGAPSQALLTDDLMIAVIVWLIILTFVAIIILIAILLHRQQMKKQGNMYLQYIKEHPRPMGNNPRSVFAFPTITSLQNYNAFEG